VSLGEIARRTGVGAGTVYRHFPTKDVLLEAVLSQRVERLTRLAVEYAESGEPGAAFFDFVVEVVTSKPGNRDMCELLESEDGWPHAVLHASGRRFNEALRALLHAAQQAGAVRADPRCRRRAGTLHRLRRHAAAAGGPAAVGAYERLGHRGAPSRGIGRDECRTGREFP
jgi:AcrR family transcriptional regulator